MKASSLGKHKGKHDWVYARPVKHPLGAISIWEGHRRRCTMCRRIEYLMGTSCGSYGFWSDWPQLKDPPAWPKTATSRKKPEGSVKHSKRKRLGLLKIKELAAAYRCDDPFSDYSLKQGLQ